MKDPSWKIIKPKIVCTSLSFVFLTTFGLFLLSELCKLFLTQLLLIK